MYNLYYKGKLINTKGAVGDDAIEQLASRPYVFKVYEKPNGTVSKERIPVSEIKVVKTYVF